MLKIFNSIHGILTANDFRTLENRHVHPEILMMRPFIVRIETKIVVKCNNKIGGNAF